MDPSPAIPAWKPLGTADLLAAWDRSRAGHPWQRAVVLLGDLARWDEASAAARLDVGGRDRALLALHLTLFGDSLEATSTCRGCGQDVELRLSAETFLDLPVGGRPDEDGWLVLRVDSSTYRLRLPTSEDLAATAGLEPDNARQELLSRCAPDVPAALWTDPGFEATAVDRLAQADPCADLVLSLVCPYCEARWPATFDIATFLWRRLDGWAHRVLYDVQLIAGAYGWSEPEIFALPPWRREYYAQGVGA